MIFDWLELVRRCEVFEVLLFGDLICLPIHTCLREEKYLCKLGIHGVLFILHNTMKICFVLSADAMSSISTILFPIVLSHSPNQFSQIILYA